tara:strand:+ start:1437 stop:1916 length:480 start_codon:yes stop_codon:yes gene_type:complete
MKHALIQDFLKKQPMDIDFEERYLEGLLDSIECMAEFEGSCYEAYVFLVCEFFESLISRTENDGRNFTLYRGLVDVSLSDLNQRLGKCWSILRTKAIVLYSNGALLEAQFSAADINFVEAFNNFVGEGINDFELNPVFGSIPSKLVFNELELNPTKYRV